MVFDDAGAGGEVDGVAGAGAAELILLSCLALLAVDAAAAAAAAPEEEEESDRFRAGDAFDEVDAFFFASGSTLTPSPALISSMNAES